MAYTSTRFGFSPAAAQAHVLSIQPYKPTYGAVNVTINRYTTTINPTPVTPKTDPKIEGDVLYDKPIPLSVLGKARIGGSIIFGPYFSDGKVTFAVSFGFPADPTGSRIIYDIAFDSMTAWSSVAGGTAPGDGTFAAESFTFRFYQGTLTQSADPLETTHFPGEEIAYRPQMVLFIENLSYARFTKPVPYVACLIGDTTGGAVPGDGVNLGNALELVAYSPWSRYTSATFEQLGVTDIVPALLFKDNFSQVELCQSVVRAYRNINLLQSDKLRIKDRGSSLSPDFVFTKDMIIGGDDAITIERSDPSAQPRELEIATPDPDQDYTTVTSLSQRARDPVVTSAAVGRETLTLPLVLNASIRQSLVTFAQFYEENARKRITFSVLAIGFEVEPGDLVVLSDLADGIDNETWKVVETLHGANYVVQITAETILRCSLYQGSDPYFGSVVLLLHMDGSAGSTAFVDSSSYANPVTAYGDADISASSKFGSGALVLDGTGDGLLASVATLGVAGSALSQTNTSPYTIECWAYFNATNLVQYLVAIDTGLLGRFFRLWQDGDDELKFRWDDTGGVWDPVNELITSGLNLATHVWYHIAADKDSTGKVRLYVNGVMWASDTPANSIIGMTGDPVSIGTGGLVGGGFFHGYIDDVRITRGVSRYGDLYGDASFSPPSDAFPDA